MFGKSLALLAVLMWAGCSRMEGAMKSGAKSRKAVSGPAKTKVLQIGAADLKVEGIAPYQVFPSKDGKSTISLRVKETGVLSAWVVRDSDGATVAEANSTLGPEASGPAVSLKEIPVGGEYTVHVRMGKREAVIPHVLVGELWVVSGQSNALGGPGEPYDPIPQVHILRGDQWTQGRDPLFPWFGGEVHITAWVQAAREYYRRTGIPVGLMGYCAPAREIDFFMDVFRKELAQIKPIVEQHGKGASVYLWYQGESDIETPRRRVYMERLKTMAEDMRRYAGNPEMTMVIVQLSYLVPYAPPSPLWGKMRDLQRRFCVEDPHAILAPALPYPHKDPIHLSAEGQRGLGDRIAQALAEMRQAGKPVWQGPRAVSARFADASRKRIRVDFDSAKQLRLGGDAAGSTRAARNESRQEKTAARDPKEDWFVTDANHRGVPDALGAEIQKGVLKVEVEGARLRNPKIDPKGESATFELAGEGYVRPVRVRAEGVRVILELSKPAGKDAKVSYGVYSDSQSTLSDEQGRPAAAFLDLSVTE